MAIKQRDPTVRGQRQIKRKLHDVFLGKPVFISGEQLKSWYGRNDNAAIRKLKQVWLDHLEWTDWSPPAAPKLFVVGPISTPKRGWVIGRRDKQKELVYELGA